MRILGCLVAAALATACACKQNGGGVGPGTGSGTGAGTGSGDPAACAGIEPHVTELYQAAAERTKLTPEEVADNVAMVRGECQVAPGRVVPCVRRATSVAQLEGECLAPLDDEGSEGLQFQK